MHRNKTPLFDHTIGAGQHGRRNGQIECCGGLEIEDQFEFSGELRGEIVCFSPRKILAAYVTVSRHLSLRTGAYEICLLPQ